MTAKTKKIIDDMSYNKMLSLWRNSPSGNSMFEGETGEYFSKVMHEKKVNIGSAAHTQASKNVGWGDEG